MFGELIDTRVLVSGKMHVPKAGSLKCTLERTLKLM